MKQQDVLETMRWAEGVYGSLISTTGCPRRDILRAVKAGLAKSIGMVAVMGEDCCIMDPERHREGFVLTEKGRDLLDAQDEAKKGNR